LKGAFGSPTEMTDKFKVYGASVMNQSDAYYQGEFVKRMERKRAILESAIEQLQLLAPPIEQVAAWTCPHF
jgi:hypothetical protein